MASELKPCPFCGSENITVWWNCLTKCYDISCRGCFTDFCMDYSVIDEAKAAWNRRVTDEQA